MKKFILILITIITAISFTSCIKKEPPVEGVEAKPVSIIAPTGTPALGIAPTLSNLINDKTVKNKVEIVSGSDLLIAAFTQKNYDIIVAPVNLGAKMYQNSKEYVLYKTIVWGNLYLMSNKDIVINDIKDLANKKVTVFGKNSTPDIVFKSIIKNYNVNVEISYVSDVTEANTVFLSGKADIVMGAEPSISQLKKVGKKEFNTFDLQDAWKKMTGSSSYPQAGIFVKKSISKEEHIEKVLTNLKNDISTSSTNVTNIAKSAVSIHSSFEKLTQATLEVAIPNCNYQVLESDKKAVEFYFQKMIDLGFGAQIGGSLPVDEFYY